MIMKIGTRADVKASKRNGRETRLITFDGRKARTNVNGVARAEVWASEDGLYSAYVLIARSLSAPGKESYGLGETPIIAARDAWNNVNDPAYLARVASEIAASETPKASLPVFAARGGNVKATVPGGDVLDRNILDRKGMTITPGDFVVIDGRTWQIEKIYRVPSKLYGDVRAALVFDGTGPTYLSANFRASATDVMPTHLVHNRADAYDMARDEYDVDTGNRLADWEIELLSGMPTPSPRGYVQPSGVAPTYLPPQLIIPDASPVAVQPFGHVLYAVGIDAGHDDNGNPLRGWMIYDASGDHLTDIAEEYMGRAAMDAFLRDYRGETGHDVKITELCNRIPVTSEYYLGTVGRLDASELLTDACESGDCCEDCCSNG